MLSKNMEAALNQQMELESYASFLYLSMASWCDQKAMEGCVKFMERQSDEERQHMLRIFHYINEMDGHALVPAVNQPPHDFNTIQSMFEQVYTHEQKVTASIHKLVELSQAEKDPTTYNFLQWFVDEQREEEALMRNILDRIKLIGEGPQSLYYIDKEVEKINTTAMAAEGGEA
ncbi:MAG: ferritin [Saprospiraceae bacterium]|nr:ferritin [Lewinella sp.]